MPVTKKRPLSYYTDVKLNVKLKEMVYKWKKILRLEDWDVIATYEPLENVSYDAMADNQINVFHKRATIRVICEEDFDKLKFIMPFDPERSIVHELIHIHMHEVQPKYDDYRLEQVVNSLTKAFLSLDRGEE